MTAAADVLGAASRSSKFVDTYGRMQPLCRLRANAFYFGAPGLPPRAIIYGPWLYVHAPTAELPLEMEKLSEAQRKAKHLGTLHARLPITDPSSTAVLPRLASALRSAASRS